MLSIIRFIVKKLMEDVIKEFDKRMETTFEQQTNLKMNDEMLLKEQIELKNKINELSIKLNNMTDLCNNNLRQLYELEGKIQLETVSEYENEDGGNYIAKYISDIKNIFDIHCLEDKRYNLFRCGNELDGGYIMVDDLDNHNIAYSFGINDDVSWDKDISKFGINVFMYDHTINNLPEENEFFHWKKVGVTGIYDSTVPELKTLEMLLNENGHMNEKNMILKLDIEGDEWSVLKNTKESILDKFDQIVIEFHDLINFENSKYKIEVLEKIMRTHLPVHIHANNYRSYIMAKGKIIPDVLECLFLNRSIYNLERCRKFFPGILDKPNCNIKPEIILGVWGKDE